MPLKIVAVDSNSWFRDSSAWFDVTRYGTAWFTESSTWFDVTRYSSACFRDSNAWFDVTRYRWVLPSNQ